MQVILYNGHKMAVASSSSTMSKDFLQNDLFCVQRDEPYNSSAIAEIGDHLATTDTGQKVGAAVPLSVGGAGSPSNTMSHGPRPTSTPSGILIHPTVWPQ